MTLDQLKESLAKQFTADMGSSEVFFIFDNGGRRDIDALAAVGIVPVGDTAHVALVALSEVLRMQKQLGHLPPIGEIIPPGVTPGDEWKNDAA